MSSSIFDVLSSIATATGSSLSTVVSALTPSQLGTLFNSGPSAVEKQLMDLLNLYVVQFRAANVAGMASVQASCVTINLPTNQHWIIDELPLVWLAKTPDEAAAAVGKIISEIEKG